MEEKIAFVLVTTAPMSLDDSRYRNIYACEEIKGFEYLHDIGIGEYDYIIKLNYANDTSLANKVKIIKSLEGIILTKTLLTQEYNGPDLD